MVASAFIMAVLAFILVQVCGEDIKAILAVLGTAIVVIPMVFISLSGMTSMLGADAVTTQVMATNTIDSIVTYFAYQMPGYLISEMAGATVGVIGGLFVGSARPCR